MQEAQKIGENGTQAMIIARTQGQIEATKAANDKMKVVTPEQLQTAKEDWQKANPGKVPTSHDINNQAYGAAVAAGAGYLAPGYKIGGNTLINMGGAFMTDGPDLSAQRGAIAGSLFGGGVGKYAPSLLAPYAGSASGVLGDIGGALTFESINDRAKQILKSEEKK